MEQPGALVGRDARAVITDLEDDAPAGRAAGAELDAAVGLLGIERLKGINEKIDDHLAHGAGVGPDGVGRGVVGGEEVDSGFGGPGEHEVNRLAGDDMQGDAFHLMPARVGEVEQLLGETVDSVHLGGDEDIKASAKLRILEAGGEEVCKGLDRDEGVPDLMSQAGPEQADGRKLFGLAGLPGEAGAGQDVVHELGDLLHLLHLGVGEGAVIHLGA